MAPTSWWPGIFHWAFLLILIGLNTGAAAYGRVVLLVERGASTYQQAAEGFRQTFSGTDALDQIDIDESGRIPSGVIENLREKPPRLVVAIGTLAARSASERLPDLPILYCLALRPERNRLIGSNVGGVVLDVEASKQLESVRQLLPGLRHVGTVYDDMTSRSLIDQARHYLGSAVQLVPRTARTPQEAQREIRDLLNNVLGPDDAFWLLWDSVAANPANFKLLVELSLRNRVPIVAPARPFVEAGALISAGANYEQAGRQVARMAQQVLAGWARPGDFSGVPPSDLSVTINGEVARQFGVIIPLDFRADILSPASGARRR